VEYYSAIRKDEYPPFALLPFKMETLTERRRALVVRKQIQAVTAI